MKCRFLLGKDRPGIVEEVFGREARRRVGSVDGSGRWVRLSSGQYLLKGW